MLKIQITKDAYKFLNRLPQKQSLQLKNKLQLLQTNPIPPDSRTLTGFPDYHRVTVGKYRIIYRHEYDTLLVSLIGKRNDDEVYKKLKRLLL